MLKIQHFKHICIAVQHKYNCEWSMLQLYRRRKSSKNVSHDEITFLRKRDFQLSLLLLQRSRLLQFIDWPQNNHFIDSNRIDLHSNQKINLITPFPNKYFCLNFNTIK